MADPVHSQPQQVTNTTSSTVTVVSADTQDGEVPTVRLRLRKPKTDKKVQWTTETVDNEEMNKKKSKCCCIYKKPKQFDDSSSSESSDDECEHCQGHVEKKKKKAEGHNNTVIVEAPTEIVTVPEPENGEPNLQPDPPAST